MALSQDTLFLACTRPAMRWGVPVQAFLGIVMFWPIVLVLTKNPFYLFGAIPTHYALRLIVARDYNMFQVIGLWLATKGRALNAGRWGGSSVNPLPVTRASSLHEVRTYV